MSNKLKKYNPLSFLKANAGFTLMEIIVATTIFALVGTSLMALFNNVLKINRRSEALRQASQGMRNFAELLVKEIRNGQIDYYVQGGNAKNDPIGGTTGTSPCGKGFAVGGNTYAEQDNKLGIITNDGFQECIYFADENGYSLSSGVFSAPAGKSYKLMIEKNGNPLVRESLVPANYRVENFKVIIRPVCDPYSHCTSYGNDYPRIQPSASIFIKFVAQLPTGEQVPIYYQTSVSGNDYNIPTS